MAKQMNEEERKRLDVLLGMGLTPAEAAQRLGRPKSTVVREIIKRAVPCLRGYGSSNRVCASYDYCTRTKGYGGNPRRLFRCTAGCFEACPEFVERRCERLDTPSHVCNGCERFRSCPLKKRIYDASGAQANRESLLHESRRGVHPGDAELAAMDAVLSPGLRKGQSIRHVIAANPEVFASVKERTVYTYVSGGLFEARRGDLPEACSRRPRRRKRVTKTDAKCRVGRTYKEFIEHCRLAGIEECAEVDTVIGRVGGKVLFTVWLPGGLMLAFLRRRRTSNTATRLFRVLRRLAGPELFQRLFAVILTDNGSEFSDPAGIEKPVTALGPADRPVRVFYTDPYCSSQKPHVERTHRDVRRILEHGVSFDGLTQADVNLVMSHVNSYTRGVLDGRCAWDEFVARHGEPGRLFLGRLGLRRIPPSEVILDPYLLGKRFERLAAKAVLRKNGVPTTPGAAART